LRLQGRHVSSLYPIFSRRGLKRDKGRAIMSLEDDIAALKRQEEVLRFKAFDEAAGWKLGSQMRDMALTRKLPLAMEIRIGIRPLFYVAMPGTTPENPDWVRRKVNTVYRFESCSYRIGLEYKLKGASFDESRGLDPLQYAPAGGGFPIRIIGTGLVGAVTVSGIPQRDDHAFVAENIAQYLGVAYADIALGPETA
jgi:uncharacterized protein (UPF0303 family)